MDSDVVNDRIEGEGLAVCAVATHPGNTNEAVVVFRPQSMLAKDLALTETYKVLSFAFMGHDISSQRS
jgi:hypothetical protein